MEILDVCSNCRNKNVARATCAGCTKELCESDYCYCDNERCVEKCI